MQYACNKNQKTMLLHVFWCTAIVVMLTQCAWVDEKRHPYRAREAKAREAAQNAASSYPAHVPHQGGYAVPYGGAPAAQPSYQNAPYGQAAPPAGQNPYSQNPYEQPRTYRQPQPGYARPNMPPATGYVRDNDADYYMAPYGDNSNRGGALGKDEQEKSSNFMLLLDQHVNDL